MKMFTQHNKIKRLFSSLMIISSLSMTGCAIDTVQAQTNSSQSQMVTDLMTELAQYQQDENSVSKNLKNFDTLDFEVFSHQKWQRLHESHGKNVKVHWPDGRTTEGIDTHIEDLKGMFVYAPDTRIETHPIKFGRGEWTAVIGILEGTFTQPMPLPNGEMIQPTGKPFKITMATIGHWKNGVMDEEFLFWDNQIFMKQIGLAQ